MDHQTFSALGLHVLAKPIGPICNLDCAYCYYLAKEEQYPAGEKWRMPEATLELYVQQLIAAQPPDLAEMEFAWQGGEPTLLGVDFFKRVVDLQRTFTPPGKKVNNSIQTNGVLLDDQWCAFLKAYGFLVGVSIDGPADLHDRYRYDKQGNPTHGKVLGGLRLLQKHGVEHNLLVVVNRHNARHPKRVYRFLKDLGVPFIQFIPIVERMVPIVTGSPELPILGSPAATGSPVATSADDPASMVSERSVLPDQFGRFLVEVFDEWVRQDVGKVFVQLFDQALAAWLGIEPSLCVFRKECGRALAIEHNGDVFSCDHYVFPEFKLGNIHEQPLAELANSDRQLAFGSAKSATLPQYCRDCGVLFACNGECPKNRFIQTPDGEPGLNYLCAGYKMFFEHVDPYMRLMAEELRNHRPAANVMHRLRAQRQHVRREAAQEKTVGRNDRCPCGSGRKYKKCCMREAPARGTRR